MTKSEAKKAVDVASTLGVEPLYAHKEALGWTVVMRDKHNSKHTITTIEGALQAIVDMHNLGEIY